MSLQDLLDENGITYFGAREFWSRSIDSREKSVEPPEELWTNIIPTALLMDEIRELLGSPVRISAYRSPEYNKHVGSKPTSEHPLFRAADLWWDGPIERLWEVAREVVERADMEGLRTGLGLYDTFVHVDTGSEKGLHDRRRWDSRTKE